MTLQEFISENKVLVCEYEAFRARTAHPDYSLGWSRSQFNDRYTGRTKLKDSEVLALKQILYSIRHPQDQLLNLK